MPRCGCQDACSCLIVAGDGISVEGIGTLERPYEITSESSDLVDRIEFTDEGNVDFTVTGVGTINDPTTVFADAKLAVTDLTDVSPTDTPVEGDVLVWRIDHWEFEQQSGSGGGAGLPPGGTDGQVLTKQSSTDGDANWEDPTGGSGGPVINPTEYVILRQGAAQSMAQATETVITFGAAQSDDPLGMWNGSDLVTIKSSGLYEITYSYGYAATAGAGNRITLVRVNGTTFRQWYHSFLTSVPVMGTVSFETKLNAGDTIQVRQYQSSGAPLDTTGTPIAYAPSLFVSKQDPSISPGGGGVVVDRTYALSARMANTLSVPNNSNGTVLVFDTIDYADGLSINSGVFTAPVAGYYQFSAKTTFDANATGFRRIRFITGGSSAVPGLEYSTPAAGAIGTSVSMVRTLKMAAGDTLTVQVDQTSGAALNISGGAGYTSLDITKVPQAFSGSAVSTYGEQNYFACRGHAAATSIPHAVSTIVPFDTTSGSDGITWDGSGFIAPVAGLYDVEAVLTYAGSNTTGARYVLMAVDGGSQFSSAVPGSATASGATVAATLKLAAGQRIEIRAYQTSGAALALSANPSYNRVSVTKVPAPVINGAAASGVFGVAPLNIYGSGNDKMGREVYIDTAGQLRSAPSVMDFADNGFTAATPIGSYPQGFSILSFNSAANTDWPVTAMPGQVNTMRRNSYGVQHFFLEKDGAAANQAFFFRITYGGAPGTWGPWQAVWQDTGWLALTGIASGWTVPSPYVTPQARLLNGEVIFRGRLVNATFTGGYTDLAVLPATIPRPTDTSTFPAATNTPATKAIQVMTGGVVQIYQSAASGAHLDFASVRYPIN